MKERRKLKTNLRKNLKNERLTAKLNQKQIAEILNITERHYQSLEAGTSNGSVPIWEQLSTMFQKTINYLLERTADSEALPLPAASGEK